LIQYTSSGELSATQLTPKQYSVHSDQNIFEKKNCVRPTLTSPRKLDIITGTVPDIKQLFHVHVLTGNVGISYGML
jgi:hypothetical protein